MSDFEAVAPGLEVFHEQGPPAGPPADPPAQGDAPAPEGAPPADAGPDPVAAVAAAAAVAARLMQQHGEAPGAAVAEQGEASDAQEGAEANNKRPREEEGAQEAGDEEPEKKRASTGFLGGENGGDPVAAAPTGYQAGGGNLMEQLDIPSAQVGKLIGKAGETIRNLQDSTGTRVQVDHSGEGPTKHVTITGVNPVAVAKCKADILALIADEETSVTTECPASVVGRIIGRGGETIRSLQSASQAHITVDQNYPEGVPRKIIIQGGVEACRRAEVMIQELITGDPGSAQAIIQRVCQQHGIGSTHVMSAPKSVVGRIIGRAGETIKQLQRYTGATIQIDQVTDPCRITIAGQPPAPDQAKRMIGDIINGIDPFRPADPYAAYSGAYGGYSMPGAAAYGAYGAMGGFPGMGPYGAAAAFPGGFGGSGFPGAGGAADPYAAYAGGMGGGGYPGAAATQAGGGSAEWQELHDDQGRPYYYNAAQGVTQWEKPPGFR